MRCDISHQCTVLLNTGILIYPSTCHTTLGHLNFWLPTFTKIWNVGWPGWEMPMNNPRRTQAWERPWKRQKINEQWGKVENEYKESMEARGR